MQNKLNQQKKFNFKNNKIMKQILFSIAAVIAFFTLSSSGCGDSGGGGGTGVTTYNATTTTNTGTSTGSGNTGTGGSTAKFTISKNRLYVIAQQDIKVYNIANAKKLEYKIRVPIGKVIETLFPYGNSLFIGSNMGMFEYDISNPDNPTNPKYVQHVTSCDPVVANDSIAFLTLRTGAGCQGTSNVLQAYSLAGGLRDNTYLYQVQFTNPYGLALSGKHVYVCDAQYGMGILNITKQLNQSTRVNFKPSGIHFFDLIPFNNYLMAQTQSGICFMDISDATQPTIISQVKN
jgi:hypothetical protein